MQGLLGKPRVPSSPLFVFDTQPLTKPPAGVLLHRSVGLTDRPQTEVVSPTINLPVERCYQRCRILLGLTPAGHLADRLANTLHSFLGRSGAPVGPPRLRRVASTKRESRPTECHREPLVEPDMNLSAHPAPIKQTRRSYRYPSVRRVPFVPGQAFVGTGSPGPCGL